MRRVLIACVEGDLHSNELWQVYEELMSLYAPVMGGGHSGKWVNHPVAGLPDSERSDILQSHHQSFPPPRT